MYGPKPARVVMVGQLLSGYFHMDVGSPPRFVVEIELLREVDVTALNRLKSHWGGQGTCFDTVMRETPGASGERRVEVADRGIELTRQLGGHNQVRSESST